MYSLINLPGFKNYVVKMNFIGWFLIKIEKVIFEDVYLHGTFLFEIAVKIGELELI